MGDRTLKHSWVPWLHSLDLTWDRLSYFSFSKIHRTFSDNFCQYGWNMEPLLYQWDQRTANAIGCYRIFFTKSFVRVSYGNWFLTLSRNNPNEHSEIGNSITGATYSTLLATWNPIWEKNVLDWPTRMFFSNTTTHQLIPLQLCSWNWLNYGSNLFNISPPQIWLRWTTTCSVFPVWNNDCGDKDFIQTRISCGIKCVCKEITLSLLLERDRNCK